MSNDIGDGIMYVHFTIKEGGGQCIRQMQARRQRCEENIICDDDLNMQPSRSRDVKI